MYTEVWVVIREDPTLDEAIEVFVHIFFVQNFEIAEVFSECSLGLTSCERLVLIHPFPEPCDALAPLLVPRHVVLLVLEGTIRLF